ncbi:unnamed protein product [Callosobruchus maculatus]|uniref:Uncharacterized protein n=1 Tax=Callosobruchus maculatus TaxID=64391 RepID=A0A653DU00_CALMS|nr:unnamed protein product [Callosobruchus maculatus]
MQYLQTLRYVGYVGNSPPRKPLEPYPVLFFGGRHFDVPAYFENWQYVKIMDETLWLKKCVTPHEYFYEPKMKTIKHLRTKDLGF